MTGSFAVVSNSSNSTISRVGGGCERIVALVRLFVVAAAGAAVVVALIRVGLLGGARHFGAMSTTLAAAAAAATSCQLRHNNPSRR